MKKTRPRPVIWRASDPNPTRPMDAKARRRVAMIEKNTRAVEALGKAVGRLKFRPMHLSRAIVDDLAAAMYRAREGQHRRPRDRDTWAGLVRQAKAAELDGRDGKWVARSVLAFYRGLARAALIHLHVAGKL